MSLKLLLKTLTSNQAILLFFADEVTDKARYTQIPLSRNSTNSKVLGNLLPVALQVYYDCFLLLFPCDSFSCSILVLDAVKLFSIVYYHRFR